MANEIFAYACLWGGPADGKTLQVDPPPDEDTPPELIAVPHLNDAVMYEPVRRMENGSWRYQLRRSAGV